MHIIIIPVLLLSIAISACSSSPHTRSVETSLSPRAAIMLAADAAPKGIAGVFEMTVKDTGSDGGIIYLNSEADYRDQRSLNIAIHPLTAMSFMEAYSEPPEIFFDDKLIRVSGEAKRTKIVIGCGDRQTDMHYYQTQVRVGDMNQIEVLQ